MKFLKTFEELDQGTYYNTYKGFRDLGYYDRADNAILAYLKKYDIEKHFSNLEIYERNNITHLVEKEESGFINIKASSDSKTILLIPSLYKKIQEEIYNDIPDTTDMMYGSMFLGDTIIDRKIFESVIQVINNIIGHECEKMLLEYEMATKVEADIYTELLDEFTDTLIKDFEFKTDNDNNVYAIYNNYIYYIFSKETNEIFYESEISNKILQHFNLEKFNSKATVSELEILKLKVKKVFNISDDIAVYFYSRFIQFSGDDIK